MGKFKLFVIFVSLFSFNILYTSTGGDTITSNQSMKDGETLVSEGGVFELGFFSPGNTSNRYLGIWYRNIPVRQVVWVANREAPITSSTGVLKLSPDGNLSISDHISGVIWSTATLSASDPLVQLLDTGNLVLSSDSKGSLWQSFEYPSHVMLPGMKLGRDFRTNREWKLTSWKNDSDPSPGAYTYMIDTHHGPPEGYVLLNGSNPVWRSGPWDGNGWDGFPAMTSNGDFHFHLISNHDEIYYDFELINKTIVSPLVLEQSGVVQRLVWLGVEWEHYWKLTPDVCDTYAVCGSYGVCQNDGSPIVNCKCLRGFRSPTVEESELLDWSRGCLRTTPLGCVMGDGFVKLTQLKLPDTSNTRSDSNKSLDECSDWCLQNCSCLAYAVTSPEGGGCIIWFSNLIDIREFAYGGEDLYVRLAASELDEDFHRKKRSSAIIFVRVISGVLLIGIFLWMLYKKLKIGSRSPKESQTALGATTFSATDAVNRYETVNDVMKDSELPLFSFSVIATSTNNLSNESKIGEGGFGPVYKGILPNGQEVAVKRLSQGSVQGVQEFKNEIRLIANLQHKNLVRLLGCCVEGEERILVYEYLPNRSLDHFLFDSTRAVLLDWQRRIRIIYGVAQGLLYLHKYSRLKIIHRDLKSSNVLLDSDMNPKISDFGTARIFGGNQDHANTKRIVGTYGYMPPEYAIEGYFSEKSDVFSFGVLLLEIVSGKRSSSFHQLGDSRFLIGHAWKLWKDGQVSELMDPVLRSSCALQELNRSVHVGLLCVQENAADRPTMSTVISFLNGDIISLPSPKTVAFCSWGFMNAESHLPTEYSNSSNKLTITAVGPR